MVSYKIANVNSIVATHYRATTVQHYPPLETIACMHAKARFTCPSRCGFKLATHELVTTRVGWNLVVCVDLA